jgi:hypothetical protein
MIALHDYSGAQLCNCCVGDLTIYLHEVGTLVAMFRIKKQRW